MEPTTIHGLSFAFSDNPIIKYKVKHHINIDALRPRGYFQFQC